MWGAGVTKKPVGYIGTSTSVGKTELFFLVRCMAYYGDPTFWCRQQNGGCLKQLVAAEIRAAPHVAESTLLLAEGDGRESAYMFHNPHQPTRPALLQCHCHQLNRGGATKRAIMKLGLLDITIDFILVYTC